jgi:hypothetical protein
MTDECDESTPEFEINLETYLLSDLFQPDATWDANCRETGASRLSRLLAIL